MSFDRDAFYREVGLRLQFARKAQRKTQHDIAAVLAMPRATYANFERGRQRIPVDVVWRASVVLGIPLRDLLPEPVNDSPTSNRTGVFHYRLPTGV